MTAERLGILLYPHFAEEQMTLLLAVPRCCWHLGRIRRQALWCSWAAGVGGQAFLLVVTKSHVFFIRRVNPALKEPLREAGGDKVTCAEDTCLSLSTLCRVSVPNIFSFSSFFFF